MRPLCNRIAAMLLVASLIGPTAALAAAAKKYQVTGTVIALTDDVVTIQKPDGDKWELNRDPKAVVKGTLKVGEKVTVQYTMTATAIEVKPAK